MEQGYYKMSLGHFAVPGNKEKRCVCGKGCKVILKDIWGDKIMIVMDYSLQNKANFMSPY